MLDNAYTGIHVLQTSVTEVSQAGAGIYESLEGAGDLTEDKPHRVINTDFLLVNYTDLLIGARSPRKPHYCFPLCALAAAATQSSLWCPDFPHCSNLPSSAAPLHRAHTRILLCLHISHVLTQTVALYYFIKDNRHSGLYSALYTSCVYECLSSVLQT